MSCCVPAHGQQFRHTRYSGGMRGRDSGPLTKHLRHPAVIHHGRSLTPHDHSPTFKLVSTPGTKPVDGMLAVTFWRLIHDHTEILLALGAVSGDVLSHSSDSYRLIRYLFDSDLADFTQGDISLQHDREQNSLLEMCRNGQRSIVLTIILLSKGNPKLAFGIPVLYANHHVFTVRSRSNV